MIKIVDLGTEVAQTGERRVNLIDDGLLKLASNDIQKYWAELERKPGKAYLHVIAMTDSNKYGPNNNGDWFEGKDLREWHHTFTKTAHIFLHHVNKDPKKSIGKPIYSFYNENMARVELILEIDKSNKLAKDVVEKIKRGEDIYVSMGVSVAHDVCSICGNKAKTRRDYCFVGSTLVTMSDGSVKPIEEVRAGDRVLSAEGTVTEVIQVFEREVEEQVVSLRTTFNGLETKATRNHPFLASNREDFGKCFYQVNGNAETLSCLPNSRDKCKVCKKTTPARDFVPVGSLRTKDILYSPIIPEEAFTEDSLDPEEAWVVGLFMAEGSYGKQKKADGSYSRTSLQFALNGETEQEYIDRLIDFFKNRYQKEAKVYPGSSNSKGVSVRVHSKEICDKYFHWVGEYSQKKKFSEEIFYSKKETRAQLVRGLWDGDGYTPYREGRRSVSRLNSASQDLVAQTSALLTSMGHDSFHSRVICAGGPGNRTNTTDQYYIQGDYQQALLGEKDRGSSVVRGRTDNHIVGYITSITSEEYKGKVYNFETSMGTYIANGIAVHNCDHLKYNMKRILPDGRQVYAKNPAPLKFFDISVVSKPADRTAWALEKAASMGHFQETYHEKTSAELGEEYEKAQDGLRGLKKLSEMVKKIDGDITEVKDEDESVNVLRRLKELDLKHLDYPALSCEDMDETGARPGALLRAIIAEGAPPSLGELAYISGKHHMGDDFSPEYIPEMLSALPGAARMMMLDPGRVFPEVGKILGDYDDDLESPEIRVRVIRKVRPVARQRIVLIKQACSEEKLEKTASESFEALPTNKDITPLSEGRGFRRYLSNMQRRDFLGSGPGMYDTFTAKDESGNEYVTNRVSAMIAEDATDMANIPKKIIGALLGLAALGAAVSDASAMQKLVATPALGAASMALLKGKDPDTVSTAEGVEVPVGSVFSKVNTSTIGKSLDKTAANSSALRNAALMGMAVPAGLGLDYLFNRHIRYRNHPMPEAEMGPVRSKMYQAGRFVADNPLATAATAGMLGGLIRSGWRGRPYQAAEAAKLRKAHGKYDKWDETLNKGKKTIWEEAEKASRKFKDKS